MKKRCITILSVVSLVMVAAACGPAKPSKVSLNQQEELDFLKDKANMPFEDISDRSDREKAKEIVVQVLARQNWDPLFPKKTDATPDEEKGPETTERLETKGRPVAAPRNETNRNETKADEKKAAPPAPDAAPQRFSTFIQANAQNTVEKATKLNPYDFVSALGFAHGFASDVLPKLNKARGETDEAKGTAEKMKIWKDAHAKGGGADRMAQFNKARDIFMGAVTAIMIRSDNKPDLRNAVDKLDGHLYEFFTGPREDEDLGPRRNGRVLMDDGEGERFYEDDRNYEPQRGGFQNQRRQPNNGPWENNDGRGGQFYGQDNDPQMGGFQNQRRQPNNGPWENNDGRGGQFYGQDNDPQMGGFQNQRRQPNNGPWENGDGRGGQFYGQDNDPQMGGFQNQRRQPNNGPWENGDGRGGQFYGQDNDPQMGGFQNPRPLHNNDPWENNDGRGGQFLRQGNGPQMGGFQPLPLHNNGSWQDDFDGGRRFSVHSLNQDQNMEPDPELPVDPNADDGEVHL